MTTFDVINQELEKIKDSENFIIVEGKKDKKTLEKLGLKNIEELKEPIFQLCERLSKKCNKLVKNREPLSSPGCINSDKRVTG